MAAILKLALKKPLRLMDLHKQIMQISDEITEIEHEYETLSSLVLEFSRLALDKLMLDLSAGECDKDSEIAHRAVRVIQGRLQAAATFYNVTNAPLLDSGWKQKAFSSKAADGSSHRLSKTYSKCALGSRTSSYSYNRSFDSSMQDDNDTLSASSDNHLFAAMFSTKAAEKKLEQLQLRYSKICRDSRGLKSTISRFKEDNIALRHEVRNTKKQETLSPADHFWSLLGGVDLFIPDQSLAAQLEQQDQDGIFNSRDAALSMRRMSFTSTNSTVANRISQPKDRIQSIQYTPDACTEGFNSKKHKESCNSPGVSRFPKKGTTPSFGAKNSEARIDRRPSRGYSHVRGCVNRSKSVQHFGSVNRPLSMYRESDHRMKGRPCSMDGYASLGY